MEASALPPNAIPAKKTCAAEKALKMIGGRWKLLIIGELISGVKRFNELLRSLDGITQKMLTQQLRELEEDGIIHRQIYAQIPPKVEYSLTELGHELLPIIESLHQWGEHHPQQQPEKD